ncbi:MAG: nucleotidyl transferase AbiEii/AbiGii toxin family protein [Treponema sp.]|nr:nucleotidyl transferase AbiEii/AbiGii toxin family protein [Treponema sp.]
MLQKKSVKRALWDLLVNLQNSEIFKDYFLVGGTSLSLQMGHRMSDDIDLFTRKDINKEEIFNYLNINYYGKYQIHNIQNNILQISINNNKIDFVKHDYDFIEEIKNENGIKYLGKKDISAMKLMAVANRGDQAKDFIDIYYLLKKIKLEDMFKYYMVKYNQKDISAIKRSLVYFDDVTDSNWSAIKLLKDKLSAEKIKNTIIKKMNNYNKNIIECQ